MEEEIKRLHIRRGTFKASLTGLQNKIKDVTKDTLTAALIKNISNRVAKIEENINGFNETQNEIEYLTLNTNTHETETLERNNILDLYYDVISIATDLLADSEFENIGAESVHNSRVTSVPMQYQKFTKGSVKLPTINLPTFEGSFTKWRTFIDSFNTVIHHNNDLVESQKLSYLKSAVKGEPFDLICTLETIDENYEIALNILKKRYDNVRRIVTNHVQSILNIQATSRESPMLIKELINTLQTHINCLRSLKQPVDSWDAILVPIITAKLDLQTEKEWESKLNSKLDGNDEVPLLSDLIEFLTSKLMTLETVGLKRNETRSIPTKSVTRSFATVEAQQPVCANCKQGHLIYHCDTFLKLSTQEKNTLVRKLQLCINCLRKGHINSNCRSFSKCRHCRRNHHTLLHIANQNTNNDTQRSNAEKEGNETSEKITTTSNYSLLHVNSQTLLSTAIVSIVGPNKTYRNVRVLLDSASQSNFLTEEICNRLNLELKPININVQGINQNLTSIKYCTEITFKSQHNNFQATINCLVVPQITAAIPTFSFNNTGIEIPLNIKLADPKYNESGPVDLLIGAGLFWSLICIGQIQQNSIILQKTKIGWIISGQLFNETSVFNSLADPTSLSCVSLQTINRNLEKFWQYNELEIKSNSLSTTEEYCENYFAQTTTRDEDGRFIVKIPFNSKREQLCDSFDMAKNRYYSLEKRFLSTNNLQKEYSDFINEYIGLNHMQKIDVHETLETNDSYYLPHHCVLKESSTTTKLRVVFDGSAVGKNGLSLNDIQYAGPTLQNDIFSIISRFRLHSYVFAADIEKMYRQIWLHPSEQRYQRIFWRENTTKPLDIYELKTVTYGTKSAPYLAIRCLIELANQCEVKYPTESHTIKNDFYVDDVLTGADDLDELRKIKDNIIKVLALAGFKLRKFISNSKELSDQDLKQTDYFNISDKTHKLLGICWNPIQDQFFYSFNIDFKPREVTKRTILAITAQMYDPLGLLGPIIVVAKLIIQKLWSLNLSWDEAVPMDVYFEWIKFKDNLPKIDKIQITRHVVINKSVRIEIHAFSDASERAYGSCIYLKSFDKDNNCLVHILAAKSRVAPLKQITLPRLELNAALLSAQLVDKFKDILGINIDAEYYWCDSQIALCWLKGDKNRWTQYVSHRVVAIQNLTNVADWYYVQSNKNPADCLSRGISPEKLLQKTIWWQGPDFLHNNDQFNVHITEYTKSDTLPETKETIQSLVVSTTISEFPFERFSSLIKLKRVMAYVLRFVNNSQPKKHDPRYGQLKLVETYEAFNKLIQIVQQNSFPQELQTLSDGLILSTNSKLLCLTPFIDNQKIIRVGGRLNLSEFCYDKKHPIILPKHNHLTDLIIEHEHNKLMHAGAKLVLNSLRDKFWPISGMNSVKKIIKKCVKCAKVSASLVNPIMGSLPLERTILMYPFHSTGVDYCGPYLIRAGFGRQTKTIKCYVCLFICFTTKAIHLELVTSLTTDAFLLSLKRFIARRGKPLNVFSDNGTNFVGAKNELSKLGEFLIYNVDDIQKFTVNLGINWQFIPPRSPTFGGLWEAGVKTVKFHLKRILTNVKLTYEEFSTILTQIESTVNSRPLVPLTSDPNDTEALTPAHFLIGRSFTSLPDPNVKDIPKNRLNRYQLIQQLNNHFWNKWSKEYINHLQQRTKWKTNMHQIKIGELVTIKDENIPPAQWRLGRILHLHPGKDGVTRVVTIKCANGIVKRATNRVCVLPVEQVNMACQC